MTWLQRLFRGASAQYATPPPFPHEWLEIVHRRCRYYPLLRPAEQQRLRTLVSTFILEKQFVAGRGMSMTDEVRVTIAAHACLLLLGIPDLGVYPQTREVIVQHGAIGQMVEAIAPDGRKFIVGPRASGQAQWRGPILISWDQVVADLASPGSGRNVIIHEFAHALDFLNHIIDGTPPLSSREQSAQWARVFTAEFERLKHAAQRDEYTFMDPYGASNTAEFFAVATEHFFDQPRQLKQRHTELYRQLQGFYQQDPAEWAAAA